MKIFNFEIDPNNLTKNQILSGVAVLIVSVTVVFGLFGNSGLFTGNVGDTTTQVPIEGAQVDANGNVIPADTGNEQTPSCTEPNAGYAGLIESINQAVEGINGQDLNVELAISKESIVTATEGLLTLIDSLPDALTNDCIQIGSTYSLSTEEEELTIFELIELFNDSADDFNTVKDACTDCTVDDITKIDTTFACSNSRVFDEEDQTCNDPPPQVCDLQDKYNATAVANNLLISFKDKSTTFSATDYATLKTELAKIDNSTTGNIFASYLTTFDYRTQGEALSSILVNLANTIRASGNPLCNNLAVLSQLMITPASTPIVLPSDEAPNSNNLLNSALNNRVASNANANSCPANSTFDSVVQGCYCPLKNKYLSGSEKCEVLGTSLEIPVVTCDDGEKVANISSCNTVDKEEVDPDFTDDFELPEDLPGAEKTTNKEIEDPLGDALVFPDTNTNTDNTNNSNPPSLGTESNIPVTTPDVLADIDTSSTLISNTNANVMRSNTVQGNTGPGLWLALLISFTGTYLWFRKSN
jgi:hypothetical protein